MRLEQTAHMLVLLKKRRALKAMHFSLDGLGCSVLGELQGKIKRCMLKHEGK